MPASVFDNTTFTAMLPDTPTDPPAAPATVMVFTLSVESALTDVVPVALVSAKSPILALVLLEFTATLSEAPTPAEPPAAPPPETIQLLANSSALTVKSPPLTLILAASAAEVPSAMMASVELAMPIAPKAPPTAVLPPPPSPTVMESVESSEAASTSTALLALISVSFPTLAVVVLAITPTFAPAPTPVLPPKEAEPTVVIRLVSSIALTRTSWSASAPALFSLIFVPWPMEASVVLAITLAATVAATLVEPLALALATVVVSSSRL